MALDRKGIIEHVVEKLKDSGLFKEVFSNTAPVWTNVRQTPAAAVIWYRENNLEYATTGNRKKYAAYLKVYLYNSQKKNEFEDILSPLVDEVSQLILNDADLCDSAIEWNLYSYKRDGGMIHPNAVAELQFEFIFLK